MPTTTVPSAPAPDDPARKPHRPYGDHEARLLSEVMARPEVGGNLAASVALLQAEQPDTDWNYQRCYKLVQSNPYLKAYHPARNPDALVPNASDILDRTPLISPEESKELRALVSQNHKTIDVSHWVDIGLDQEQAKRMTSMERFSRQPLKSMVATTHGSVMFVLGMLLKHFEETAKRISDNNLPDEFDKEGNPRPEIDVERDWHAVLLRYSSEIRAIKAEVDKGNLLLAKVEQMSGENGGGKISKEKPGFSPMTVNAHPGSQVAIMPTR